MSDDVMKDEMREKIATTREGEGSIRREIERGRKIWYERRDGKEMSAMKPFILDGKQFTWFSLLRVNTTILSTAASEDTCGNPENFKCS